MTLDILVAAADRVNVIRINRPQKKNALTGAMYRAMTTALRDGERDPGIAVHVVFGAPGVFSAGNDLGDFLQSARNSDSSGAGGVSDVLDFIRTLPRLEKPLVAGVDGLAVGVGVTMLLHCDLVYASPAATFATPFVDLGLVPEAGSSLLMPRIMGHQRAFEMLVLGAPFSAERAEAAGLVNAIVPADNLEEHVLGQAQRLAAKPPGALRQSRDLMRGNRDEIVARVEEEARLFQKRLATPEAIEAFTAFLEKRRPDFSKFRS